MTRENSKRDDKAPFHAASPRPWHGMTIVDWLRLLAHGRFAVSTTRLPMAVSISLFTLFNSMLRPLENLIYGRGMEEVELEHPPLFIVGHWRTGTTLLHELVVQDEQFSFPSHLQVTTPHHFLSSAWFTGQALRPFLPKRRPMDNMALRLHLPQEDEIALMILGLPSPYLSWAWPNGPAIGEHSLTLEGLSDEELERWKATFLRLVKRLALKDPRRLVVKSPTHTARLKTLLEMFPDAQFIHIVRDPIVVFPSMIRTWKRLQYMFGLQVPRYEGLEEYLLDHLLAVLPSRVHPRKAARLNMAIGLDFSDSGKQFTFFLRRGVGEVAAFLDESCDLVLRMSERDFKRAIVAGEISPVRREFWKSIEFEVEGNAVTRPLRILLRLARFGRSMIKI